MAYAGSNSPAVKRLAAELRELTRNPAKNFTAEPLEDELFEWHFTITGPPGTSFEGGRYHGRIIMPPEYPMKPPDIYILTPNGVQTSCCLTEIALTAARPRTPGRFETGTKICLSYTSFHAEEWQPAWGVRTMLNALAGIFPIDQPGCGHVQFLLLSTGRYLCRLPVPEYPACQLTLRKTGSDR